MDNKKIELIDIDDNDNKSNDNVTKNRKRRLKKGAIQTIFCLVSALFIIGCAVFYGSRLIKYYKIYNPKSSSGESVKLLAQSLIENSPIVFEGSGVYRESGSYIYKGSEAQNYIKFSNMLWRIIKTNADNSVDIILEEPINALAWDTESKSYIESNLHKYINDVFLSNLNKDYLVKTNICTASINDVMSFSCGDVNIDYYVKLLGANDFLNTVSDDGSYISNDGDMIWLGTATDNDLFWHTDGNNISTGSISDTYLVKPVVTIKNSVQLLGGTGSMYEPYIIETDDNDIKVGSYLKIDNDNWIVYEKSNDTIKLVYAQLYNNGLTTYRYSIDSNIFDPDADNSLAKLLNTTFYESLSYKDLLLEFDLSIGEYKGDYSSIYDNKVKVKVGVPTISDLKFDVSVSGYFLANGVEQYIYYWRNDIIPSKVTISRPIRPTISIKKPNIKDGNGTIEQPFVVEV